MISKSTVSAALLPLLCLAACAQQTKTTGPPTASQTPAGASPSTSIVPGPLTLAELTENPCRAVSYEDHRPLGIVTENLDDTQATRKCTWLSSRGAMVSFTPFPRIDITLSPENQGLTADNVAGHPALMGQASRGEKTSYLLLVSTGPGQSFQITALNSAINPPGPHTLTVAKDFATTILEGLHP